MSKLLEKLKKQIAKDKSPGFEQKEQDPKEWRLSVDAAKNGNALVRLLPAIDDDHMPYVHTMSHGFKGPNGKWYIENCPKLLKKDCPICSSNSKLWSTKRKADEDLARTQGIKHGYYVNVMVLEDKVNPDNVGKVFWWKMNKSLFKKVEEAISPPVDEKGDRIDPDQTEFDPFDLDSGANLRIICKDVGGWANFDSSSFRPNKEADFSFKDIKADLTVLESFVDESLFKSYDELVAAYEKTQGEIGSNQSQSNQKRSSVIEDDDDDDMLAKLAEKTSSKKESKKEEVKSDDDSDDDLEFFKKLAED